MMDKSHYRNIMRQKRHRLTVEQQQLSAERLKANITTLEIFQTKQRIACYLANDGEIDPQLFMEQAIKQQKACYLPVIDANDIMHFARYTPGCTMTTNRYGIDEPQTSDILAADQLDIIFLPLVAFDLRGERLGRGKGYYDHTLGRVKGSMPILIGLAYAFQQVDQLPRDEWDIALNGVCTDNQYLTFS